MNASPFLSYIKDAAGRLLFYNKAFAKRFGVGEYTWLGRTDERLWSPNLSRSVRAHDLEVMAGDKMVETEERIRTRMGRSRRGGRSSFRAMIRRGMCCWLELLWM